MAPFKRFEATLKDMKNKVLHIQPLPDKLTEEAQTYVRGLVGHEMSHIKNTEVDWNKGARCKTECNIINAIEDCRINNLIGHILLSILK